jgi:ABC-2 type transport system permease protein
MNLFLREMRANRKSLLIWSIGVIFMVTAGMSKYGALSGSKQSLGELMAQMPKSLQAIMGIGNLDLSTAIGYFGILFLYLVLMAVIHALMLGATIIAKEERDKTSEFLLVKPISRQQIITAKLAAALVNVVVFNMITLFTSLKMVAYYNNGNGRTSDVLLLMVGMLLLQLLFLFLGTGIAAISKHPKRAVAMGTVILLVTFILSILVDLNQKLEGLKYLTPFKYFEAKNLLADGVLDPIFVTLSSILIAILACSTYIFFNRRDMNV